jgi:rhodanese-related sulfurtransferase
MQKEIHRGDILLKVDSGYAQLVEVLPEAEYEKEHLPKAISIPLSRMTSERMGQLRINDPIIVYCNDYR